MKNKAKLLENTVHGIFLILGCVTVAAVLLISIYLIIAGIPAIREIGLKDFLFGTTWNASGEQFGILPFILTSVYGTAGAILIGTPIGFFTAVYLSKMANPKVRNIVSSAVSLLAGISATILNIKYGVVVHMYHFVK